MKIINSSIFFSILLFTVSAYAENGPGDYEMQRSTGTEAAMDQLLNTDKHPEARKWDAGARTGDGYNEVIHHSDEVQDPLEKENRMGDDD